MKKTQSKKVATFHSAWEKHSIISFINPFITLFQDTFSTNFSGAIFVSKIAKKHWQKLCGKKVKQKIIHNGVDKIFYPIKKQTTSDLKLLFLGRLVDKKGPKYLLKATRLMLAAFKINSMDIKIAMTLRRVSTPKIPIQNKTALKITK